MMASAITEPTQPAGTIDLQTEPQPSAVDFAILGATGLKQWSGQIDEELLPQLSGTKAAKVFREMSDNDAICGAILFAIQSLIGQVKWRVEPADESDEAARAAEFVESCVVDMSHTWEDFISEVLSMLVFGWSFFEIVYKIRHGASDDPKFASRYEDGMVGWRKLSIRSQESLDRWEFDADGGLRGFWQRPAPTYDLRFVPIEKALLFRTLSRLNNPEGRSIFRNGYRSWFYEKRIQEIEAVGIERDLTGYPVMEVPMSMLMKGATEDQKALLAYLSKMIVQVKRDEREGAIVPAETNDEGKPTGYKLKLLSTGGRRQIDTNAIVTRYEQRIAMSALAEFIMLGMQEVGSRSLASSKTEIFSLALGGWLDKIAGVLNMFAIPRLMEINGFASSVYPTFVHGDLETPDLAEVGAYVVNLANAGIPVGAKARRKLLDYAELPEDEEQSRATTEDEMAAPQSEAQNGGAAPGGVVKSIRKSRGRRRRSR
jgi:hypothetical protein